MDLFDKMAYHGLRDLKFRDHAVAQGPDGDDVGRGTAHHLLGLYPYGQRSP